MKGGEGGEGSREEPRVLQEIRKWNVYICMCIYEYSLSCHFLTSEHLISFIEKKNFFSLVCYF